MFTTSPSLLERLREPNQDSAWNRFVDIYTPLFYSWTKRLGLSSHQAADLVQDLFVTLVEALPHFRYDPSQSFRAWLKTLLLNRWRNWLRKEGRLSLAGEGPLWDVPEMGETPEFEEAEYRRYLVGRALELMQSEFQPATWKACWEFVVNGRPPAEVAAELGLSVNSVYLAKSRVLRRLREELSGLLQ